MTPARLFLQVLRPNARSVLRSISSAPSKRFYASGKDEHHHDDGHHDDHHDDHASHEHDHHEAPETTGKFSFENPPKYSFFENNVKTPRNAPKDGMLWGVDLATKSEEPRGDVLGPYHDELGPMVDAPVRMNALFM